MNKEKIGMLKEKYRRGVGMMIINKNQEIFIGQRFEKDKSAWQMPQGCLLYTSPSPRDR